MRGVVMAGVLGLAGCALQGDPAAGIVFVAPLDGQAAVPTTLELKINADLPAPTDEPVARDRIAVVDLATSAPVPGITFRDGDEVRFAPDAGWEPDHAFAWSIRELPGAPRTTTDALSRLGDFSATFSTGGAPALLAATLDPVNGLCLVLGRPVSTADLVDLAVDLDGTDTDRVFTPLAREAWETNPPALDPGDAGPGVACDLFGAEPPASVRATWRGAGPWRVDLDDRPLDAVVDDLRWTTL